MRLSRMSRGKKLAAMAVAIAAGLGFTGFLIASSGLVSLGATSGHWSLTEWFLQYTKRRVASVRSFRVPVPDLEDRFMVVRGAGHYELACRSCHGSPGTRPPVVLRHMLPHPPTLSERVLGWEPEELFWIVKHGIKLTGMPGWPALARDDEVWDVVAFLRELPGMEPAEYRELSGLDVIPPPDSPRAASTCARCHGADGRGRAGATPRLAGQSALYLDCALEAYSRGHRFSGYMEPIAFSLSPEERTELARYYGSLPAAATGRASEAAVAAGGEEIALRGIPRQKVPACAGCHGPAARPRRANYPRLAGQPESYLLRQLDLFRQGRRGGSPFAHLMRPVAAHLTEAEGTEVAGYYASLSPETASVLASGTGAGCGAE